jgi:threonine synthase
VSQLETAADTARAIRSLRCVTCGHRHPARLTYGCTACGGILEAERTLPAGERWQASDFVDAAISLGEGGTRLRSARNGLVAEDFGGVLYLKDETRNPSGSFKDRLVAAAMSEALRNGAKRIVCASSGNAGASVACYAAHAGIEAIIVCPTGTPAEKLAQITAYGATLVRIDGNYSNSFDHARSLAADEGLPNLTTTFLNPFGVDALRLVGQELCDDLGGVVPDWVIVPTGSGPLVKGVIQGFLDVAGKTPRIVSVQAEGCAPIVQAFDQGADEIVAWGEPRTFASGISDPLRSYVHEGSYCLRLVRESGGLAVAVTDAEIERAMRLLASGAGLYAEPTGAASLAAARRLVADGRLGQGDTVVCMITGHGFKDSKVWALR